MNVWASLFGGNTPAPQPTNGPGHEVRNDWGVGSLIGNTETMTIPAPRNVATPADIAAMNSVFVAPCESHVQNVQNVQTNSYSLQQISPWTLRNAE
jgi:hypothetical protein